MSNWMLRGVACAVAMVVVRLVQGVLIQLFPKQSGWTNVLVLIPFVALVLLWGWRDGRADAAANVDPERRADLPMIWLIAGLVAGLLSGIVAWAIALGYRSLHTGGLIQELTTFTSFTALLVFVTAMVGVTIGRWLMDRQHAKRPVRHHGLAAAGDERADTDVFAAVSADDLTAAGAALQDDESTAVIATVPKTDTERTEPTARRWWPRRTPAPDAPTEAAPIDAEQTQQRPLPEQDQG